VSALNLDPVFPNLGKVESRCTIVHLDSTFLGGLSTVLFVCRAGMVENLPPVHGELRLEGRCFECRTVLPACPFAQRAERRWTGWKHCPTLGSAQCDWRKKLVLSSWAMVVSSPWPAMIRVSDGSSASFLSDCARMRPSPPGRSVRPQEPLKRVSPVKQMFSSLNQ